MEEVRGEAKGKPYQGIIYFALNENGEKVGTPFKSSLFGKIAGILTLEQHIEKSEKIIKDKRLKERCKQVITAALRTCHTRADFEKALQKQGITAIFRTNDEGRIYGATFIDHQQNCVFNGSRLGKEFSANVFNDLFKNETTNHPEQSHTEDNHPDNNRPDSHQSPQTPEENQPQPSENPLFSLNSSNSYDHQTETTTGGGFFSIFTSAGSSHSDDLEEQALTRHLKKKKRKPKIH
jgi:hypothetical protein